MKIEVYHAVKMDHFAEESQRHLAAMLFNYTSKFTHVGTVEVHPVCETADDKLNFAFERTNHIDQDWGLNESVTTHTPERRSTSVGDVLVMGNEVYLVAPVGFAFVMFIPEGGLPVKE